MQDRTSYDGLDGAFTGLSGSSHGAFFDVTNPMEVEHPTAVFTDDNKVFSYYLG